LFKSLAFFRKENIFIETFFFQIQKTNLFVKE
jgi:hypothetical protein